MIPPKTSAIPPANALTRRRVLATGLTSGLLAPALLRAAHAAAPVDVAGPEALATALRNATPGTVLRLAPGAYGTLAMNGGGGTPGAPVTLTAADPADPPRFDRMGLHGVRHLTLDGLHFAYRFATEDPLYVQPFRITGTHDLVVLRSVFAGDQARGISAVDDGFGYGMGLSLTGCEGAVVEACEFFDFHRALVVHDCSDLSIRSNDLHTLRMDGMNFAQVKRLLVEDNHIHDFNRSLDSEDHADMIQFWTNRTTEASTDIVIRGNRLNSGSGWYTQSIFMRNERVDGGDARGKAGRDMFYRRVTIEENVIINAHLHGITVGETEGLTIRRNTLVRNPRSEGRQSNPPLWVPTIRLAEASRGVTVEANVAAQVTGYTGQSGWKVAGNLLVQDRTRLEPNHYETVFEGGDPTRIESFRYRRGGPLDGAGIGAASLQQV